MASRGIPARRTLLRALLAAGAPAAVAGALLPVVTARDDGRQTVDDRPGGGHDVPAGVLFDETYRGRRLRGRRVAAGGGARERVETWIDGRPLRLMRRADGSYLSMVDHYTSYGTPLAAVRGAVDELHGARLAREARGAHGAGSAVGGGVA